MTLEPLYRVVFNGITTGEYNLETTMKRFGRMFHLDQKKTKRLFTGEEFIIKNNVIEDVALKYAIKVAEAGCECVVGMVPEPDDLSREPGFVERR